MKRIFLIVALVIGFNACQTSESEEKGEILIGNFSEVSPINEIVQLEFTSNNQLRRIITNVSVQTTFTFTIRLVDQNKLELSCNECDVASSQIVSYPVIDNNRFEIGGLFPAEAD